MSSTLKIWPRETLEAQVTHISRSSLATKSSTLEINITLMSLTLSFAWSLSWALPYQDVTLWFLKLLTSMTSSATTWLDTPSSTWRTGTTLSIGSRLLISLLKRETWCTQHLLKAKVKWDFGSTSSLTTWWTPCVSTILLLNQLKS